MFTLLLQLQSFTQLILAQDYQLNHNMMNIERTLFLFQDGDERVNNLSDDYFGLGNLLNRLLNEVYDGKKIKFINLYFHTNKTYALYPVIPKEESYYYGGHLKYYGVFDKEQFEKLSKTNMFGKRLTYTLKGQPSLLRIINY